MILVSQYDDGCRVANADQGRNSSQKIHVFLAQAWPQCYQIISGFDRGFLAFLDEKFVRLPAKVRYVTKQSHLT